MSVASSIVLCAAISGIQPARASAGAPTTARDVAVPATLYWVDFDGDAHLDAFTVGANGIARLLRCGEDGAFEDVTERSGLVLDGALASVVWADFDGDGRSDLFALQTGGRGRLFHNEGGGTFLEHGEAAGLAELEPVLEAQAVDYDADGQVDLHLVTTVGHRLYRNEQGRFEPVELPDTGAVDVAPTDAGSIVRTVERNVQSSVEASAVADAPDRRARRASPGSSSSRSEARMAELEGRSPGPSDRGDPPAARPTPGTADAESLCVAGIRDLSSGACVPVSVVPAEGALYPLGLEFFIDPTGDVGIGTTSPEARLDVRGDGGTTLRVDAGDLLLTADASLALGGATSSSRWGMSSFGTDELFVGVDAWDSVVLGPSGALTALSTGEVGIGTNNPAAPLEVRGDGVRAMLVDDGPITLGWSASLAALDPGSNPRTVVSTFGTDDLYLGADVWDSLVMGPAGSLTALITGEVGIGTNDPAAPLELQGNGVSAMFVDNGPITLGWGASLAALDSGGAPRTVANTYGTNDLYIGADVWNSLVLGPSGSLTTLISGEVGIGTNNPTAPLELQGNGVRAMFVDDGPITLGWSSSLSALDSGGAARRVVSTYGSDNLYLGADVWNSLILGPSGSLTTLITGEVGIGTNNPTAPLELHGNGVSAMLVDDGPITLGWSSSLSALDSGSSPRRVVSTYGGDDLYIGADVWNSLVLGPSGSLTALITGEVGIGTNNPTAPLDLRGNGVSAMLVDDGSLTLGWNASLSALDSGSTSRRVVSTFGGDDLYVGADVWNSLVLGPSGSLTTLISGEVGIGTNNPTTQLEVRGNGDDALRVSDGALVLAPNANLVAEDPAHDPKLAVGTYGSNNLYVGADDWDDVFVGPTSSLTVASNGNVGIGVASPGNILTVQKGSATDPVADAWTTYSSRRWKKDIETLDGALSTVMRLRGVTYRWKESDKEDVGFIAEEVGDVVPEVVQFEDNGVDARSVDYARLTAVLVEAVKEQQSQIDALRAEVEELRARESRHRGRQER